MSKHLLLKLPQHLVPNILHQRRGVFNTETDGINDLSTSGGVQLSKVDIFCQESALRTVSCGQLLIRTILHIASKQPGKKVYIYIYSQHST